jgi:sulfur relay (sulfurtransferase) DsrF/TusC family protein
MFDEGVFNGIRQKQRSVVLFWSNLTELLDTYRISHMWQHDSQLQER